MNEITLMVLVFIAGLALGTLFFGGLWFTVKKVAASKTPAIWIFSSFFFRMGITLIGFYFIGAGNWQRLLICVSGFIASRFIIIYLTKSIDVKQIPLKKEANDED